MANEDEEWRKFDLLLANFQAIGKWQSRFVNSLVAFLLFVWAVDLLHASGGITVQVLGARIQIQGFWQIVPLVTAILSLGLIGSINIITHAWRRLILHLPEVFSEHPPFFFTELDAHKNVLDFLGYLTLSLTRPILPDTTDNPAVENRQWNPGLLLYPALIFFSVFTTSFTLRRIEVNWWSLTYVSISTGLQGIFAIPFLWRKVCLFTGVHKTADEGTYWGDAGLNRISDEGLRRLLRLGPQ